MALIGRASVADDFSWRVYNKIALRILPLILVSYIFASIDRVNVAFAKLQMGPALGLTETMYGFGAGVFFIGYCLFEIPSNMMLHRIGARVWLARIMVVWGLLSTLTMFVQTPTHFYIIRFLLGIAEAGFYPGALLYLTYWFPSYVRSQAVAVMLLGTPLAAIIGSPLSGAIMRFMDGWAGLAGWQWVFVVEGLPAAILGVIVFVQLRSQPSEVHWLDDEEKALVTRELAKEHAAQAQAGMGHRFGDAFRDSNIWCVVLANFCNLSTLYGIQFWLPTIVQRVSGATVFNTGLIVAALSIIPCAVLVINARHSDRTRERRWHATVGFAITAFGLCLAGTFSEEAWLALGGLMLAYSGVTIVSGTIFSLPATFLMGAAAAAGFALITTIGNLSGYTTPFLFGVLRDATGSFSLGFYAMATTSLVGAAAMLSVPALRRKPPVAG
ncbi:MFS transporter [Rhizorhabdus dicambivorans]|uniref:MFS transporter n=2 Tax=Rhizorhabdus dicambivorans TaxID=1850238 RepID=A0A2A4FNK0_9SPHN|nr:MFS transporter [Rhizorhabdus dicambivorans]ATE67256.1 MFS transporter [Rhizorhabdus dicambivorans]PCE39983.1 MFS transporter [Rhizorhabdus dicambivorans]